MKQPSSTEIIFIPKSYVIGTRYEHDKEVLLPSAIAPDPLNMTAVAPVDLLNCWKPMEGVRAGDEGIDRSHQTYIS